MTINDIISDILRREGWPKYTNRASDKGGPTKGGITLKTLSDYRKRACSVAELQALSEDDARRIYFEMYAARYDFLPHDRLKALLVDYAVTSWHDDATRDLQIALNKQLPASDVFAPTGTIGPKTRAAVARVDLARVYVDVYRLRQDKFFREAYDASVDAFLRSNDSTQLHNLHGWMNRLAEFV